MSAPRRVQRRRIKGWRKPEGSVCVTRPSRWANPYVVGIHATDRAEAVELYRRYLADHPELVAEIREHLAGKVLCCYCPVDDRPCHADVLLEVANGDVA